MKKALIILFVVGVLVLATLFILGRLSKKGDTTQEKKEETTEVIPEKERTALPPEFEHDLDRDGLLDIDEARYGTSDLESDTDGDGLTDSDEVKTWGTDPTKADTDGDGFADFMEILAGFNPKGTGTL